MPADGRHFLDTDEHGFPRMNTDRGYPLIRAIRAPAQPASVPSVFPGPTGLWSGGPVRGRAGPAAYSCPIRSAAMKALWGISTSPNWRMRFLPSFCLSSSLRLRLMSPP